MAAWLALPFVGHRVVCCVMFLALVISQQDQDTTRHGHRLQRLHQQLEALGQQIAAAVEEIHEVKKELHGSSPPLPQSSFLHGNKTHHLGNGRSVLIDDILYGYDQLFESHKLFSHGSWLGVPCQQDPADAMVIGMMVWELKPKVIVDIGTNTGGSAVFFAHFMSQYAKPGSAIVITIDPEPLRNWDPEAKKLCHKCDTDPRTLPVFNDYVKVIKGSSHDTNVFQQVKDAVKKYALDGAHVLVSVDGDHNYDAVLQDLNLYGAIVTVGSYMISQDTKLDRLWNQAGPLAANREFVSQNHNFMIDRTREVFWYTHHVEGFLKRIK